MEGRPECEEEMLSRGLGSVLKGMEDGSGSVSRRPCVSSGPEDGLDGVGRCYLGSVGCRGWTLCRHFTLSW